MDRTVFEHNLQDRVPVANWMFRALAWHYDFLTDNHIAFSTACALPCAHSLQQKLLVMTKSWSFLRYMRGDALKVDYERGKALDRERRIEDWLGDSWGSILPLVGLTSLNVSSP